MDNQHRHSRLLSERYIRLLQIKEEPASKAQSLTCYLEVFDLDNCPPYDALSYTWGPPSRSAESEDAYSAAHDRIIYLDDHKEAKAATIGRNLYEALLKLRLFRSDPSVIKSNTSLWHPSSYLWVDALCIDQTNNLEKGHQVAMMGEIYAKAQNVYAWMGMDSADPIYPDIAWLMGDFLDQWNQWRAANPDETATAHQQNLEDDAFISGPRITISRSAVNSLAMFLYQRRYHSRLWITQEIVLANSTIMICDDWLFSYSRFSELVLFRNSGTVHFQAIVGREMTRHVPVSGLLPLNPMSLLSLRDRLQKPQAKLSMLKTSNGSEGHNRTASHLERLYVLLDDTRLLGCSDPRDIVYALLGMLTHIGTSGSQTPLHPDYDLTVDALEFKMTSLFLSYLPQLEALALVEHRKGEHLGRPPSWTMRLRPRFKINTFVVFERNGRLSHTTTEPIINASGKYAWSSKRLSHTEAELYLRGRRIGTVLDRSVTMDTDNVQNGDSEAAMSPFKEYAVTVVIQLAAFILESYASLGPRHPNGQATDEIILYSSILYGTDDGVPVEEDLQVLRMGMLLCLTNMFDYPDLVLPREQILATLGSLAPSRGMPSLYEVMHYKHALMTGREGLKEKDWNRGSECVVIMGHLMDGRRFFRTETEFGLGPAAMLPGDELWILIPARKPYILRPSGQDGRYYLIGDAYAHGIMFGEIMDRTEEKDLSDIALI